MSDTFVSLGSAAARVLSGLTEKQLKAREGKLTASRIAPLLTGDKQKIHDLWRELTGDPTYEPEDLSGVWAVRLGAFTEALNLDWMERKLKDQVVDRGVFIQHPDLPWAGATMDGMLRTTAIVCEAKHCGGREPIEVIIDRYQPQIQWLMHCARWNPQECALSVILGASEPVIEFIPRCDEYIAEMVSRATQFMECVRTKTPPVELDPIAAPVLAIKTYDMQTSNSWSEHAGAWLDTIVARKTNERAEKEIKALVPADAKLCHGHGVRITRNRAGSLALREGTL